MSRGGERRLLKWGAYRWGGGGGLWVGGDLRGNLRAVTCIVHANGASNVARRSDHRAGGEAGGGGNFTKCVFVCWVVHRDVKRFPVPFDMPHKDRNEAVTLCNLMGHQVEQLARKIDVVERHPRNRELQAQRLNKLCFAYPSTLNKYFADAFSVGSR